MPEWKEEIRRHLAGLRLDPARESEIVEELSLHLADRYAETLACGATPDEAYRAAQALDKDLSIFDALTFTEQVNRSLNLERLVAALSGFFGASALLLAIYLRDAQLV